MLRVYEVAVFAGLGMGCGGPPPTSPTTPTPALAPTDAAGPVPTRDETATTGETAAPSEGPEASVTAVSVTGDAGSYRFAVTIASDETGCDQYADWWEVVTVDDGALAYRRILNHSHPSEQPFTRSGGPVPVGPDRELLVRAHLAPKGYRGTALRGSVAGGFNQVARAESAGQALADEPPQPNGCLY